MSCLLSAGSITSSCSKDNAIFKAFPFSNIAATSLSKSFCFSCSVLQASNSLRNPSFTAPSIPMPPNSAVGHATEKAFRPMCAPAPMACPPRPYAFLVTMEKCGTVKLAPTINILLIFRTAPCSSDSTPTMKPGLSHKKRMGISKASQRAINREAFIAASLSIAPPRCRGLFATIPSGRPSILANPVRIPTAYPFRNSNQEPVSTIVSIMGNMS
mmetsp:Transcript_13237/g.29428  ORF Transcript_13237/g.29428 Transcript_13237/m.29428 type:complete len:214 (-) Transcript_13237:406-1047(-)